MRERPILFSGPMVRAILAGTKTQTRRVIRGATGAFWDHAGYEPLLCPDGIWRFVQKGKSKPAIGSPEVRCPYGDRLWVRETWLPLDPDHYTEPGKPRDLLIETRRNGAAYRAECGSESDAIRKEYGYRWRPSIHMSRWASRLTLEVTEVRVQRLVEITPSDALAEGGFQIGRCDRGRCGTNDWPDLHQSAVEDFACAWNAINGKRAPWSSNPWVWCISFVKASA